MIPFVPLFFFASMYAQISLGESASETGLYLLIFFAGFADRLAVGRQDPRPASGPGRRWSLGCAVAAVGFYLWAPLAARPLGQLAVVLHRPRRGRRRPRPQPGQHRRAQPGAGEPLRRGDRDHPDGAQLRLQPRPRRARHGPDPRRTSRTWRRPSAPRACPRRSADEIADSISQGSAASCEGLADSAGARRQPSSSRPSRTTSPSPPARSST